jgi:hypothetical protein
MFRGIQAIHYVTHLPGLSTRCGLSIHQLQGFLELLVLTDRLRRDPLQNTGGGFLPQPAGSFGPLAVGLCMVLVVVDPMLQHLDQLGPFRYLSLGFQAGRTSMFPMPADRMVMVLMRVVVLLVIVIMLRMVVTVIVMAHLGILLLAIDQA